MMIFSIILKAWNSLVFGEMIYNLVKFASKSPCFFFFFFCCFFFFFFSRFEKLWSNYVSLVNPKTKKKRIGKEDKKWRKKWENEAGEKLKELEKNVRKCRKIWMKTRREVIVTGVEKHGIMCIGKINLHFNRRRYISFGGNGGSHVTCLGKSWLRLYWLKGNECLGTEMDGNFF